MTRAMRLKREAIEQTQHHRMSRFKRVGYNGRGFLSECKTCNAYVQVIPYPQPNETTICGNAWWKECNVGNNS